MSITGLPTLVNTNTFGQWKDLTNNIVQSLEDVVTIGDAETNAGNIVIDGNITAANTIITDIISPLNNAVNIITLTSEIDVEGNISLDNPAGGIAKLIVRNSGVVTWEVVTTADHETLAFTKGGVSLTLNSTTGAISGTGVTVSETILPATINSDIGGNAATATALETARNIALSGDVTGDANFDGTADITITATIADDSHNHTIANVDGLQTELTTLDNNVSSLQTAVASKANRSGSASQSFSASRLYATTVDLGDWTITESAGVLYFATGGVNKMKLDADGNLTTTGNITAFGTV